MDRMRRQRSSSFDRGTRAPLRRIRVGICARDKKAFSKPMTQILSRFDRNIFEIIIFGDDTILNQPVEKWPVVDCLMSWYSLGFPLEKAEEYARLRGCFCINDLKTEHVLRDRRRFYAVLQKHNISTPLHVVVSRDGTVQQTVVETEDAIEVDGVRINKPFVEKPVDAEDHNIYIYYPRRLGGGSKRLFRKVGNVSSKFYPDVNHIRREGSYIYEEFLMTQGTDIKIYVVGPDYAHAEARKSPVVDGIVQRDSEGKEVRFPIMLTNREKDTARRVCLAFKQNVCGFDLLRTTGRSYVCDVNGWSFVKKSHKYYDDAAQLLQLMMLRATQPERLASSVLMYTTPPAGMAAAARARGLLRAGSSGGSSGGSGGGGAISAAAASSRAPLLMDSASTTVSIDGSLTGGGGGGGGDETPTSVGTRIGGSFQMVPSAASGSSVENSGEELRCVVAVIRHGDRTPKQKMKMLVTHADFLAIHRKCAKGPREEAKLKSAAQLQSVLEVTRALIAARLHRRADSIPDLAAVTDASEGDHEHEHDHEDIDKLLQMKAVLEKGGHFSGINRKVQLKPTKWRSVQSSRPSSRHSGGGGAGAGAGTAAAASAAAVAASKVELVESGRSLDDSALEMMLQPFSPSSRTMTPTGSATATPAVATAPATASAGAEAGDSGAAASTAAATATDAAEEDQEVTECLLILKWGGVLTHAGKKQAETLGQRFRSIMYPGESVGLLRLHSTYRHDLKIYSSDEGRVQMTAAAFVKGFLDLEGELTPILASLVKTVNTSNLLDDSDPAHDVINSLKKRLKKALTSSIAASVNMIPSGASQNSTSDYDTDGSQAAIRRAQDAVRDRERTHRTAATSTGGGDGSSTTPLQGTPSPMFSIPNAVAPEIAPLDGGAALSPPRLGGTPAVDGAATEDGLSRVDSSEQLGGLLEVNTRGSLSSFNLSSVVHLPGSEELRYLESELSSGLIDTIAPTRAAALLRALKIIGHDPRATLHRVSELINSLVTQLQQALSAVPAAAAAAAPAAHAAGSTGTAATNNVAAASALHSAAVALAATATTIVPSAASDAVHAAPADGFAITASRFLVVPPGEGESASASATSDADAAAATSVHHDQELHRMLSQQYHEQNNSGTVPSGAGAIGNATSAPSGLAALQPHNPLSPALRAAIPSGPLCCGGESLWLMCERWKKLQADFYSSKKGRFDLSKIPDIYDCIKYDAVHNAALGLKGVQELYTLVKAFADVVVSQEYGIHVQEKADIAAKIAHHLLRKIFFDMTAVTVEDTLEAGLGAAGQVHSSGSGGGASGNADAQTAANGGQSGGSGSSSAASAGAQTARKDKSKSAASGSSSAGAGPAQAPQQPTPGTSRKASLGPAPLLPADTDATSGGATATTAPPHLHLDGTHGHNAVHPTTTTTTTTADSSGNQQQQHGTVTAAAPAHDAAGRVKPVPHHPSAPASASAPAPPLAAASAATATAPAAASGAAAAAALHHDPHGPFAVVTHHHHHGGAGAAAAEAAPAPTVAAAAPPPPPPLPSSPALLPSISAPAVTTTAAAEGRDVTSAAAQPSPPTSPTGPSGVRAAAAAAAASAAGAGGRPNLAVRTTHLQEKVQLPTEPTPVPLGHSVSSSSMLGFSPLPGLIVSLRQHPSYYYTSRVRRKSAPCLLADGLHTHVSGSEGPFPSFLGPLGVHHEGFTAETVRGLHLSAQSPLMSRGGGGGGGGGGAGKDGHTSRTGQPGGEDGNSSVMGSVDVQPTPGRQTTGTVLVPGMRLRQRAAAAAAAAMSTPYEDKSEKERDRERDREASGDAATLALDLLKAAGGDAGGTSGAGAGSAAAEGGVGSGSGSGAMSDAGGTASVTGANPATGRSASPTNAAPTDTEASPNGSAASATASGGGSGAPGPTGDSDNAGAEAVADKVNAVIAAIAEDMVDVSETVHQLDARMMEDSGYGEVKSLQRHVRTRLYFTSESHVHALINTLKYWSLPPTGEAAPGGSTSAAADAAAAAAAATHAAHKAQLHHAQQLAADNGVAAPPTPVYSMVPLEEGFVPEALAAASPASGLGGEGLATATATATGTATDAVTEAGGRAPSRAASPPPPSAGAFTIGSVTPQPHGSPEVGASVSASATPAPVTPAAVATPAAAAAASASAGPTRLVSHDGLAMLEATPELDYLTHIVFRLYENFNYPVGHPSRHRLEILFSPGASYSPFDGNPRTPRICPPQPARGIMQQGVEEETEEDLGKEESGSGGNSRSISGGGSMIGGGAGTPAPPSPERIMPAPAPVSRQVSAASIGSEAEYGRMSRSVSKTNISGLVPGASPSTGTTGATPARALRGNSIAGEEGDAGLDPDDGLESVDSASFSGAFMRGGGAGSAGGLGGGRERSSRAVPGRAVKPPAVFSGPTRATAQELLHHTLPVASLVPLHTHLSLEAFEDVIAEAIFAGANQGQGQGQGQGGAGGAGPAAATGGAAEGGKVQQVEQHPKEEAKRRAAAAVARAKRSAGEGYFYS